MQCPFKLMCWYYTHMLLAMQGAFWSGLVSLCQGCPSRVCHLSIARLHQGSLLHLLCHIQVLKLVKHHKHSIKMRLANGGGSFGDEHECVFSFSYEDDCVF